MSNLVSAVDQLKKRSIQARFEELLGKKAPGFITSLIQVVNGNSMLKKADPQTVINAAATAAALDLPINPNLGFAWVIPYNNKRKNDQGQWVQVVEAQFQLGWKGYVQLALRSGQYSRINVVRVYGNQFKSWNPMTEELIADFSVEPEGVPVGYLAYFRLVNGFEKFVYWSAEKCRKHAEKYSKGYKGGKSPWNEGQDGFDDMSMKSVLKNAISKWGIMSIEMQTAVMADQSFQREAGQYDYDDNPGNANSIDIEEIEFQKERARILAHISEAKTEKNLLALQQVRDLVSRFDLASEYTEAESEIIQ